MALQHSWKHCALGEVATLQRGFDLPVQERRTGSVPIISSSGITGTHCIARVKGPGVVTGRYGTIGQVFYVDEDFWPLNTTLYAKDFHGNEPKFVSYLLRSLDFSGYSDKSSVPGVNRNHLHLMRVIVPPLSEQRAIASILGALDDKIELNRRMNETLESMARAIFKSWFVDVDSAHSGNGEMPWVPLRDLASLSRVGMNPGDFPEEQFDHFSLPAFDEGRLPSVDVGASIKSNKFLVPLDAVLVSKLNPRIPRTWLPTVSSRRAVASTEYLVLQPQDGVSRELLYCLCSSPTFMDVVAERVTGTSGSHQRARPEDVLEILVPCPERGALELFTELAAPLLKLVKVRQEESQTLASIRDTLLPKLLSGEISLRKAETLVETAL